MLPGIALPGFVSGLAGAGDGVESPGFFPCGGVVGGDESADSVFGSGGGNPANTPGVVGGANKANGAPSGTPANPGVPPTGSGTIYPPGSQTL